MGKINYIRNDRPVNANPRLNPLLQNEIHKQPRMMQATAATAPYDLNKSQQQQLRLMQTLQKPDYYERPEQPPSRMTYISTPQSRMTRMTQQEESVGQSTDQCKSRVNKSYRIDINPMYNRNPANPWPPQVTEVRG